MATWDQVVSEAHEVGALAEELWPGPIALARGETWPSNRPCFEVAYLATVRQDGAPRVHPVCPFVAAGHLVVAIPRRSPKGNDLRRDGRYVLHAMPGPGDAELCIRGVASESDDAEVRTAASDVVARSGVGGMAETVAHDPLFVLDVGRVDTAVWRLVGQPGTYAERRSWPR